MDGIQSGRVTEAFGVGTAASIAPVGGICCRDTLHTIGNNEVGPVARKLYDELQSIEYGEDLFGWTLRVPAESAQGKSLSRPIVGSLTVPETRRCAGGFLPPDRWFGMATADGASSGGYPVDPGQRLRAGPAIQPAHKRRGREVPVTLKSAHVQGGPPPG